MFHRPTLILLAAFGCLTASRSVLASAGSDDENEKANIPQQVTGTFLTSPNAVNTSRLPIENRRVFLFSRNALGRRVGDGECATLPQRALEAANGRPFRVTSAGVPGDYVWGRSLTTLRPGATRGAGALIAGDVLQFRNARFSGRQNLRNGGSRSWSYSALHHTAVVVGVHGDVVTVLEQNSSGRRYVIVNVYAMHEMKQGYIKAYRPQPLVSASRLPTPKLPKLPRF